MYKTHICRFLAMTIIAMFLSSGLPLTIGNALADNAPKALPLTPTQDWDQNLPSSSRFTVLSAFGGAAVRDNNTGLVWEQSPGTTSDIWLTASRSCFEKSVGGTVGWRLPSAAELKSIQDPSLPAPFVPPTVFSNVQSNGYWSASAPLPYDLITVWVVRFDGTSVVPTGITSQPFFSWCVRGGMNQ